jgi:dethiobiotin synthetase
MNYFVTAIDTDSGKTLVSAILCEALNADYWKPVQAGKPRDAEAIRSLITNPNTVIHPETYCLKEPASPHAAARKEQIHISLLNFKTPGSQRTLIIEGAGGCLVPLNDNDLMIDLIKKLQVEVILVSDVYLGSINHTLLTVEALVSRSINIKGIIFNGEDNPEAERIILLKTGLRKMLHIRRHERITKEIVKEYASQIKSEFNV